MKAYWLIAVLVAGVSTHQTNERISVVKCKEYGQNVKKPCVTGTEYDLTGTKHDLAAPKEFPHMALIGYGSQSDIEWICSGSLISDQYVLSVAHCAKPNPIKGSPKWIRLGELDLSSTTDEAQVQDFNISEIIIHPDYKRPSIYNDIALFKIDQPVEFSEYIRPACLAGGQEEIDGTEKFIVSGWGEEDNEPHKSLKQDKTLTKVTTEECNKVFEGIVGTRRIRDGVSNTTQLCANPSKTSACHIKSAASLQYLNKEVECTYNIAGLLSTGLTFCGKYPEIYTNVAGYLDWIERVVWFQP